MTTNEHFTDEEILLAAHRFFIEQTEQVDNISLAEDFMSPDQHLSTIRDCLLYVGQALRRGHKVYIEVPHGSSTVSSKTSK